MARITLFLVRLVDVSFPGILLRPVDVSQFTVVLGRGGDGLNEVFGRRLFILANSPFSAVSLVGQLV